MAYSLEEQVEAFDNVIAMFKARRPEREMIQEASKITDLGLLCRLYAAIDTLMMQEAPKSL